MERNHHDKHIINNWSWGKKDIHKSFPTGIELARLIDAHLITTKKNKYEPTCQYTSPMINEAVRTLKYNINYLDGLVNQLKIELWEYARKYDYYTSRNGDDSISIDDLISNKFGCNTDIYNLTKQCKVCFIGFGYDKNNLTDTLSIKSVGSAKLIGMCRSKTKYYEDVEKEFKIQIDSYANIFDFINKNI